MSRTKWKYCSTGLWAATRLVRSISRRIQIQNIPSRKSEYSEFINRRNIMAWRFLDGT